MSKAMEVVLKIRNRMLLNKELALFGFPLFHLELVETTKIPAACTNGKVLMFNPVFILILTEDEVIFVFAHEILHCELLHFARIAGRDMKLFNVAADYVINLLLLEAGFTLPKGALIDIRFKGLSVEQVYEILWNEREKEKGKGKEESQEEEGSDSESESDSQEESQEEEETYSEPNGKGKSKKSKKDKEGKQKNEKEEEGSDSESESDSQEESQEEEGSDSESESDSQEESQEEEGSDSESESDSQSKGKDSRNINWSEIGQVTEGKEEEGEVPLEEKWSILSKQAENFSKGEAPENIIGEFERLYLHSLNWRELLKEFLKQSKDNQVSNWNRPNRRLVGMLPYVFPSYRGESIARIAIAIDTSGSIYGHPRALSLFESEIQAILGEFQDFKLSVIYCDSRINAIEEFDKFSFPDFKLSPKGGGGTSFIPPFQYVEQSLEAFDCLVYFTDLMGEFPKYSPVKTLWVAYGYPEREAIPGYYNPPFGEVVKLPKEERA